LDDGLVRPTAKGHQIRLAIVYNADGVAIGRIDPTTRERQPLTENAPLTAAVARDEQEIIDILELTGRSSYRLPRELGGAMTREKLIAAFGGDPYIDPAVGGLIGQKRIEQEIAKLPEEFRLQRRQCYNALYPQGWLRRAGDVVATNLTSLHWFCTVTHPSEVRATLVANLDRRQR
jgi:hypothetical protein